MPTLHILAQLPNRLPRRIKLIEDPDTDVESRLKDAVEEYKQFPVVATRSAIEIAKHSFSVCIPDECYVNDLVKIGDEILTLAHGHRKFYIVEVAN